MNCPSGRRSGLHSYCCRTIVRASVRANAGQVRLVNLTMLNMPEIVNLNGGESQTVHAPSRNNDFSRIKRVCGYNARGMMQLSEIGGHLTARTGIDDLMEDLFKALHSGDAGLCQLNGGSPAVIPEVTELWRRSMEELVRNGH